MIRLLGTLRHFQIFSVCQTVPVLRYDLALAVTAEWVFTSEVSLLPCDEETLLTCRVFQADAFVGRERVRPGPDAHAAIGPFSSERGRPFQLRGGAHLKRQEGAPAACIL